MKRLAAVALLTVSCGQTTSYAVSASASHLPPHAGPVAIYATHEPEGTEVGVVEARGFGDDGAIDRLVPELVRRARSLGADAIVVDWIGMSVDVVETVVLEGPPLCNPVGCGTPVPRLDTQEVVSIRVRGRAFLLSGGRR